MRLRMVILALALIHLNSLSLLRAQNGPPAGVVYTCNNGRTKVKVARCTSGPDMACDVQFFDSADPPKATGNAQLSREQLLGTLRTCVMPDGRPAIRGPQTTAAPGASPAASASKGPQGASSGPLKVGDTVEVYSMFGWMKVQIVAMQGTLLKVHYPDGSEVTVEARNLRRIPGTTTPARFAADPKPDVGCAGKIEGTYGDDVGVLSITFASGKAKVTQFSGTFEADCEIQGDRIFLHGPRREGSLSLTRKNDRTLVADSVGEIRKR
jgi:hypothetical protein